MDIPSIPAFDVPASDAYTGRYIVSQGGDSLPCCILISRCPAMILKAEGHVEAGDLLGEYISATLHELLTGFELDAATRAASICQEAKTCSYDKFLDVLAGLWTREGIAKLMDPGLVKVAKDTMKKQDEELDRVAAIWNRGFTPETSDGSDAESEKLN